MRKSRQASTPHGFRNAKSANEQGLEIDEIDRRILQLVQQDGLTPNQKLADAVGLSPPACLKRVRRLRSAGVIRRTVAILSPDALGYAMLSVVRVKLQLPTEAAMQEFEDRMAKLARVVQCMTVAGDYDYVLLVRSRDVGHYQDFARRVLAASPGVRAYASEIVLAVSKMTTEIPLDGA